MPNERLDRIERALEELVKSQKELRDSHKETESLVNKTNKSVAELTDGWGMFVEGLAAPSIPKIFNRLGYKITQHGVRQKSRLRSRSIEIDIIAAGTRDGKTAVTIATSVKSRLQVDDVKEHIAHLEEFFRFYPQYGGSELLGVVVGIRLDEGVVQYAQKHGLYVIGSSGEAVELLNKKGFKPAVWGKKPKKGKKQNKKSV